MKSEFDQTAYELTWDVDHFQENGILDWNRDILIEKYDRYNKFSLCDTTPFKHPNLVIYQGYLDVVKNIDYPYPDNSWNVMSRRMYETLISVSKFPHRIIPLAIVDWKLSREDWFNEDGNLKQRVYLSNYLALQLTEHSIILDREKSKYSIDKEEDFIDRIEEYVFKVPPIGLPPIFKIPEADTKIFISAAARSSLKKAGINGTAYIPLNGYKFNKSNEIDVPIVLPNEIYQS